MNKGYIWEEFICHTNGFTQIFLDRLMVTAVHHQPLVGRSIVTHVCQFLFPEGQGLVFINWDFIPITIPVGKEDTEDTTSVRTLPVHF